MKNLVIIGAEGFAREIYDLANYCYSDDKEFRVKGFICDDPSNVEELGYPPVLSKVSDYEIKPDDLFFCGIGKVFERKKTIEIIKNKGGRFINLVHPTSIISPSVRLGIGVGIKAFCVLSSNVEIGDFTFLQSSVIMGHDVRVGKFCHFNSFSFLAGYTRINDLVTVNAGAKILQNVIVEERSVVGAGSIVIKKVVKGTTVFGIPAKKLDT